MISTYDEHYSDKWWWGGGGVKGAVKFGFSSLGGPGRAGKKAHDMHSLGARE